MPETTLGREARRFAPQVACAVLLAVSPAYIAWPVFALVVFLALVTPPTHIDAVLDGVCIDVSLLLVAFALVDRLLLGGGGR